MAPAPVTAAVLKAYAERPKGNSLEIAELAGCRPEYVRVVLARHGLELATKRVPRPPRTTPVRKYHRLQDWERQAVADAYLGGEKLSALSAEFGCTESAISRLAESRGFPRRSGPTVKSSVRAPRVPKALSPRRAKQLAAKRRREVAAHRQAAAHGE